LIRVLFSQLGFDRGVARHHVDAARPAARRHASAILHPHRCDDHHSAADAAVLQQAAAEAIERFGTR
jgi:hypothetical protein